MKPTLRTGLSRTNRISVDADRVIGFMGEEARVYATPFLVRDIENTCRTCCSSIPMRARSRSEWRYRCATQRPPSSA